MLRRRKWWSFVRNLVILGKKGIFLKNSILKQFFKYWVHKRCSSNRGTLKRINEFRWQTCINQETGKKEECPGIDLDDQSLELTEKFYYLAPVDATGASERDSVLARIRNGSNTLMGLLPLLTITSSPLRKKSRLSSACKLLSYLPSWLGQWSERRTWSDYEEMMQYG